MTGALTTAQIAQFDQQGFFVLANPLPERLFTSVKADADRVVEAGYKALKTNSASKDYVFTLSYFQSFLNRLSNFHLHAKVDSLALLGCPQVLSIAQSLCGADFLPTVDMMILKNQRDELDLPWHQDLIYQWDKYRVIAIGIYLEPAIAGDGALKLIKNSQYQNHNISAMRDNADNEIIEVPAAPGDIVVHNPMLVHWSDKLVQQKLRRTLYYEFRPIRQVVEQEKWPNKIIQQRLNLLATAQAVYQQVYPDHPLFDGVMDNANVVTDLSSLYQDPIPFIHANAG